MSLDRLIGLLTAASAAVILVSCTQETKARRAADEGVPITVATVQVQKVDRTIPVVGTLFPKDEATLGAQVEGSIEQTLVDFGDRIQTNQAIAFIDTASYEAQLEQAVGNLPKPRPT